MGWKVGDETEYKNESGVTTFMQTVVSAPNEARTHCDEGSRLLHVGGGGCKTGITGELCCGPGVGPYVVQNSMQKGDSGGDDSTQIVEVSGGWFNGLHQNPWRWSHLTLSPKREGGRNNIQCRECLPIPINDVPSVHHKCEGDCPEFSSRVIGNRQFFNCRKRIANARPAIVPNVFVSKSEAGGRLCVSRAMFIAANALQRVRFYNGQIPARYLSLSHTHAQTFSVSVSLSPSPPMQCRSMSSWIAVCVYLCRGAGGGSRGGEPDRGGGELRGGGLGPDARGGGGERRTGGGDARCTCGGGGVRPDVIGGGGERTRAGGNVCWTGGDSTLGGEAKEDGVGGGLGEPGGSVRGARGDGGDEFGGGGSSAGVGGNEGGAQIGGGRVGTGGTAGGGDRAPGGGEVCCGLGGDGGGDPPPTTICVQCERQLSMQWVLGRK
jgi:hypothetical protein